MIKNTKSKSITVRLNNDIHQNLDIMHQFTKKDKSKLIRMILNDFFTTNEELINKYYEETKTN